MSVHEAEATMAVFLDLENICLGTPDAHHHEFDIRKVLERLLLKGHIVVKKAYCDFERYKESKRSLHEAAFELIDIPHIRQAAKNSADIRMVVDALDLCYTKGHVDTFVIISGDSDFSPLVSKLRENNKTVIGIGVRKSTSDLFVNNCDEFIYYDDLAAAGAVQKGTSKKSAGRAPASASDEAKGNGRSPDHALDLLSVTLEAMRAERGGDESFWASMVKQAMKRRNPSFNESTHGFRSFSDLLMMADKKGLLKLGPKESGGYRVLPAE